MQDKRYERPSLDVISSELGRINTKEKKKKELNRNIGFIIVVAAIASLISLMLMPVFKAEGFSMSPTIESGDLIIGSKLSSIERGDIIAFTTNNKVLIKRVIALEGEVVDIDSQGTVKVNNEALEESYLQSKSYGNEVTITFPYEVPVNSVFVLGDYREESIDSRSKLIGAVSKDLIIGEVKFRIWPFNKISLDF